MRAKENTTAGDEGIVLGLPSGETVSGFIGDRSAFYLRFPDFFETDAAAVAFLEGKDESPARRLYGEIPATFPTVAAQVQFIPDEEGAKVDLLLLTGSANDLDFEDVLNSSTGSSLDEIDRKASEFALDQLKAVLEEARRKCPNAVIMVPGYFSPFSRQSSQSEIRECFLYLEEIGLLKRTLNAVFTFGPSWAPWSILGSMLAETTEELIPESISRSEFAFGRGLMLMRQAVAEVFTSPFRGPGVYYVHPAFMPENSVFAPESFLHEGYKGPDNESHPVRDEALQDRLDRFSRLEYLGKLGEFLGLIRRWIFATVPNSNDLPAAVAPLIQDLARDLMDREPAEGWPIEFREAVKAVQSDVTGENLERARVEAEKERDFLRIARLASFIHPNEAGARRYADAIIEVYRRNRAQSVRDEVTSLAGTSGAPRSVATVLRRYGLDPGVGIRACLQHTTIDSLAVETVTNTPDMRPTLATMTLTVGANSTWEVTNPNPISAFKRAGARDVFSIDTLSRLHLGDITQLELRSEARGLTFSLVRLRINGVVVFESSNPEAHRDGERWRFDYPT